MHTATLTQRFGVPALVAATFHVVLLFAFSPSIPEMVIRPPDEKVILRPFPPELLVAPPTEARPEASQEVKPLSGGPARPVNDEDRSLPNERGIEVVAPPIPSAPRVPLVDGKIPPIWGPGGPGEASVTPAGAPAPFSLAQLDRVPRAKVQPAPEYPFALRQAGIEGTVTVEFEVDATGRVVSARALQSTVREFEDAAVRAVLKWRFEPGRYHGKAVAFRMVVPIGFSLTAE